MDDEECFNPVEEYDMRRAIAEETGCLVAWLTNCKLMFGYSYAEMTL